MSALLQAENLSITFGGLKAVEDFSLTLEAGELAGLIGPNGAGKTTVFNLLTGVYPPTSGSIRVDGREITGKQPWQICQAGVGRTFQNIRLFKKMSVLDNVRVACNQKMHYSPLEGMLRMGRYWKEEAAADRKARELLSIFQMGYLADHVAQNLPYGQQRKLEIIRALAGNPKVLLLDEPAAGMNPTETRELMEVLDQVRERFGVAILLIEHDMSLVMGVCQRITVLNYGRVLAEGTPQEIANNEAVISAYLGQ